MALGAAPLFPMKKLQHKDISHLIFCGVTLVGMKNMMLAACNSQNKLHEECPVSIMLRSSSKSQFNQFF
jgi:hypothetical protein